MKAGLLASVALALCLGSAQHASACCDVIPEPDDFYLSELGSITRPALMPGFPAEVFTNPGVCGEQFRSAAADFRDPTSPPGCDNITVPCAPLPAADFALNLVFVPPAGDPNIVVIRESCAGFSHTCALPGSGQVHCLDAGTVPAAGFEIVEETLAGGLIQRRLRFDFPDTSALVDGANSLSGPARVAVSHASDPVPCGLAIDTCADTGGLVTCADTIYSRDGSCPGAGAIVNPVAIHVTALPVPNRFTDLCPVTDPSGLCSAPLGTPPTLRFTQDVAGNLIVPMDYRDVLVRVFGEPFPRTLRGALAAGGVAIAPESDEFIESRAVNFAPILPIFEPTLNPGTVGEIFGAIDAGFVFHRVFAHGCADDPTVPCSVDAECATTCSVAKLPPLPPAAASGTGPFLGECPLDAGVPVCSVGGTVTIDTLTAVGSDDRAVPAPRNECVGELLTPAEGSQNDDPDTTDVALTLLDRLGFHLRPIGSDGAPGRASTRFVEMPPFRFATHDSEAMVLASIEPELGECDFAAPETCDRNANGVPFDHILRVFELDEAGGPAADLLAAPTVAGDDLGRQTGDGYQLAVEPDLSVSGAPVAVSNGLVFFRVDPLTSAARVVGLVSESAAGVPTSDAADAPSISSSGRYVAFESADPDLDPDRDDNGTVDVYRKDRETGVVRRASVPDRTTCGDRISSADGPSSAASISGDGRWVAFESDATNLLGALSGDANNATDVFVHDVETCRTVRVSVGVTPAGALVEGDGPSRAPAISGDGRWVVFESGAGNLAPDDGHAGLDVFLHDRDGDGNGVFDEDPALVANAVSTILLTGGAEADSRAPTVSEGGVAVAFESDDRLVETDENQATDVFVDDPDAVVRVSQASDGTEGDAGSFAPSISADGRYVVFRSDAETLGPADANGASDVFVHDRETGITRRGGTLAVPTECTVTGFEEPDGEASDVRISPDGRFIVYRSTSGNLVPGDGDGFADVFMEDLRTGAIARLSTGPGGVGPDGDSGAPAVSADGRVVTFSSTATNLGPTPDPSNPGPSVYASAAGQPQPVAGVGITARKFMVVDKSKTAGRVKTVFLARDRAGSITKGAGTDPSQISARLDIAYGDGRAAGRFTAPAGANDGTGGWVVSRERLARYVNTSAPDGPTETRLAVVKPGRLLKLLAKGLGDEPLDVATAGDPGGSGIHTAFCVTNGGQESCHCSAFQRCTFRSVVDGTATKLVCKNATEDARCVALQSAEPRVVAGARLGILDTTQTPPLLRVLPDRAEHVAVARGAAAFVAPGENVKLFRMSCGGAVGGAPCDGTCACAPVVEDLLRPGVSARGAISLSETHVCALVADGPGGTHIPACHEIGTDPSASLDDVAPPGVTADSVQVFGQAAIFTAPQPGGGRVLYDVDLTAPNPTGRMLQPVRDAVLGEIACFTTPESDLGAACDANGDGDCDDLAMFAIDPLGSAGPTSCHASAVPCILSACDPRTPHTVVPTRTCKFLTDVELEDPDCVAAGKDRNRDGNCTFLVQRCTLGRDSAEVVTSRGNPIQALAGENPVEGQPGGDVDVVEACVDPARPELPLGFCPCPAGQVCSNQLGGGQDRYFANITADIDGDGVVQEDCATQDNPDPVDFDMDGIDDECDAFVCGDGQLQRLEVCEPVLAPADCTGPDDPGGGCHPAVLWTVSENAVNPSQGGNVPGALYSSSLVNLDSVAVGGLPPRSIDTASLRFAAVSAAGDCMVDRCVGGATPGAPCGGSATCGGGLCAGVPTAHDLEDPTIYEVHLGDRNADGLRDLALHFPVPGSGIVMSTTQVCLQGNFSRGASFEVTAPINVR